MIAHPMLLVEPAKQAGMKVPDDPEDFVVEEYPHWSVFLNAQIGAPLPSPSSHWDNARIIAAIPDDKIKIVTVKDLGFRAWRPK